MRKRIIVFILLFASFGEISAQSETLKGKLIKKQWSKTTESYCAGGSEYYALETAEKGLILLDLSAWHHRKIAKSLLKNIVIKGSWRIETKNESNSDPMNQHPISPISCNIFVVNK